MKIKCNKVVGEVDNMVFSKFKNIEYLFFFSQFIFLIYSFNGGEEDK